MEKRGQIVKWLDYYWSPLVLYNQTIHNITTSDGRVEGTWDWRGFPQRVVLGGEVWREIH